LHPSDKNDVHEFYLMCDDVKALITHLTLPGGGRLGVDQPKHASPLSAAQTSK
jgi:hypothetical protein